MKQTIIISLLTAVLVIFTAVTYIHSKPDSFTAFDQIEALTDDTGDIPPLYNNLRFWELG